MVREYVSKLFGLKDTEESISEWDADLEKLFKISSVYLNMDSELGFTPTDSAALCFAEVDTSQFAELVDKVCELLDDNDETTVDIVTDRHDYKWIVFENSEHEELVSNIHFVADQLVSEGYENRMLAAVYGFTNSDSERAYWVYSFRRNLYYPFAPMEGQRRNSALEFKMKSVFKEALPFEDNKQHWHPLWSDSNGHPWE